MDEVMFSDTVSEPKQIKV